MLVRIKTNIMKTLNTLFLLLLLSQLAIGQEFSFKIYFEDAIGNKDTLEFGYDINGTGTIDSIFGEINIIGTPLDSVFDVRISDAFWNNGNGTFQTKKQIVKNTNCVYFSLITIDFKCNNWPVTATWENSLFNDTCRNGSVFTSINPGGWWDTGSPSDLLRAELLNTNQVVFSSNYIAGQFDENYAYINNQNDTISVFWQAFGDSSILIVGIEELNNNYDIKIYPNPTINTTTIHFNNQDLSIEDIKVLNINGESQPISVSGKNIDLTKIPNGLYFVQLTISNGKTIVKKIIKNNAR
jgi:hypothetical protein